MTEMVGVTEFRKHAGAYVDAAAGGATIVILKHNKPVAALISYERFQAARR